MTRLLRFLNSVLIGTLLAIIIHPLLFNLMLPYSYVEVRNLNSYKKEQICSILNNFNSLANYPVFKFSSSLRKITVEENNKSLDSIHLEDPNLELTGLAEPTAFNCKIYLRSNMDSITLNQVVIHEGMHCFGYEHTDKDIDDLMSPIYNGNISQDNFKNWANKVRNKIKLWKII